MVIQPCAVCGRTTKPIPMIFYYRDGIESLCWVCQDWAMDLGDSSKPNVPCGIITIESNPLSPYSLTPRNLALLVGICDPETPTCAS